MIKFIALLMFITVIVVTAQEDRSKWTEASGELSWPIWQIESGWQNITFDEKFDKSTIDEIKNHSDCSFILFTGAWCPDSRIGTPKVVQLLGKTGHYPDKFRLIGLARDKSEPAGNNYIYAIEKVPTLIILRKGKEIGRIIEYPAESWDKDILKILQN